VDEPHPTPPPLNYVQPLFIEERPLRTWWPRFVKIFMVFMLFLVAMESTVAIRFWFRIPIYMRGFLLGAILILALMPLFFSYARAITVLEPAELQLRLSIGGFTLWRHTIHLAQVRSVENAPNYNPRTALRFELNQTQFMTGKTIVRVRLDKYSYVIGSANPTELYEQLQNALAKLA
jgi:hypothetical protein